MFVTFIGNPRNPNDNVGTVRFAGLEFPLNREIEVGDTPLTRKLRGNHHFRVRDGATADPAPSEKPKPAANLDEKAELIAFAEEHGIKIDKRWSIKKITQAIDAAAEQHAPQVSDTSED